MNDNDYVEIGMAMARKMFEKRGNHTEVHLDELTLSALLALAARRGAEAAEQEADA